MKSILERFIWHLSVSVSCVVALCSLASGVSHAGNCQWHYPDLWSGKTASGTMSVESGEICAEHFWTGPPYIREVTVGTPPSHGKISTIGLAGFSYEADAGYAGSDTFTVDILFEYGLPYARLTVDVTVAGAAAPTEQLILLLESYVAVHPAQVREKASAASALVKTLTVGQRIIVVGQVVGQEWFLVSENDEPIGYVQAGDLAKAP